MIGDSVASLVDVALLSSSQRLCAHGTACTDVYTFIRTLLILLVVLSDGPVRLPLVASLTLLGFGFPLGTLSSVGLRC